MPIKEPVPVKIPLPWKNILRILFLTIIVGCIIYIWKKRLKTNITYEDRQKFKDKANIVALAKMKELNELSLSKTIDLKESYVKLSHIVREYVEDSLFIRALEMTTDEIQSSNNIFPYTKMEFDSLIIILSNSDMAKYAKYNATNKEWDNDFKTSIDLINDTTKYWDIEFS